MTLNYTADDIPFPAGSEAIFRGYRVMVQRWAVKYGVLSAQLLPRGETPPDGLPSWCPVDELQMA